MDVLRDAAVVGDLFSRDRRGPDPALRAARRDREYSYHDLVTTAYRTCNFLRFLGVDGGSLVEIEPESAPKPLFTFFGAALLGAQASFAPRTAPAADDAPAAVIVPVEREGSFDLPPGTNLAVYGGEPADPRTAHWEAEVWSENPTVPPYDVSPDDVLVSTGAGDGDVSHEAALAAAATAGEEMGLAAADRVGVYGSLADPRVLAAGVLAPIAAGATVVLPDDGGGRTSDATVVVLGDEATHGGRDFGADAVFDADRIRFD